MKIAYMLQVHTNQEQVKNLVDYLVHNNNDVYIHVDLSNHILYTFLIEIYNNKPGVYIINDRISVNRGGLSQVKATLNLMDAVSNKEYDYVTLLSGQCLPIKSDKYIKNFLKDNNGNEFIEGNDIRSNFWRLKCYNYFSECSYNRNLVIRTVDYLIRRVQIPFLKRRNLNGYKLYKGSSWFTITYSCFTYILNYLKDNPRYYLDYKYTYCPDESFFQTLILNSKFVSSRVNDDLMEIDWINASDGSPRTYTIDDFNSIKNSNKLYARKFDERNDMDIIYKILSYIKE